MDHFEETLKVSIEAENDMKVKETFRVVYEALKVKGYNPINQIVAYIMSGDPTYITTYKDARSIIQHYDRYELLKILIKFYLTN